MGSELVEGGWAALAGQELADHDGAFPGRGGGGVAFDVVQTVGVYLDALGGGQPGWPVAPNEFAPGQFGGRAVDTDEGDWHAVKNVEAVAKPPRLAEDTIEVLRSLHVQCR